MDNKGKSLGFGRCEIPEELPHALSGFVHLETLIRCHCDGAIRVQLTSQLGAQNGLFGLHAWSGFFHLETMIRCHCDGAICVQLTWQLGNIQNGLFHSVCHVCDL